jgi:surfeit locus 1 family protein
MNLLKALFSRRWLSGTLLVLFAMFLFVRLGIWQLDRLAERRAQNDLWRAVLDSPPIGLAAPLPAGEDELENRLATATGRYDFAQERIVLLQKWQERTGVQIVTPLLLDDGKTAVLVNRGWLPQAEYEAGQVDEYQSETGMVQVTGFLALSQPTRSGSSPQEVTKEVYRIDIEAIEAALPYDLLPIYLVESPEDGNDSAPLFRAQREVDLSEGPHLGYAWQWFIFAILTGSLYLVFVHRSQKRPLSTTIHS